MKATTPPLTDEALDLIAGRFRVLGEANRLRLLRALQAGPRCVGDLESATGLSQANVSRHLRTLHDAGILSRSRQGLNVVYTIADPGVFRLCETVCGGIRRGLVGRARALPS